MKRFLTLALVAVLAAACQSAPPPIPEPEIIIERYPQPILVGMKIEPLPPLELEDFPTIPPAVEDPETQAANLKAWALEVNRIAKSNRAKRDARIRALELQVAAVNEFANAHPPPTPTPEQ